MISMFRQFLSEYKRNRENDEREIQRIIQREVSRIRFSTNQKNRIYKQICEKLDNQ